MPGRARRVAADSPQFVAEVLAARLRLCARTRPDSGTQALLRHFDCQLGAMLDSARGKRATRRILGLRRGEPLPPAAETFLRVLNTRSQAADESTVREIDDALSVVLSRANKRLMRLLRLEQTWGVMQALGFIEGELASEAKHQRTNPERLAGRKVTAWPPVRPSRIRLAASYVGVDPDRLIAKVKRVARDTLPTKGPRAAAFAALAAVPGMPSEDTLRRRLDEYCRITRDSFY